MASDTDVCNLALTYLGARRIVSLTDNVKEAHECNAIYQFERDSELRAHIWKFAVKRIVLAPLTTSPPFGYQAAYQLPSDYLRAVAVGDFAPNSNWRWLWNTSTDNEDYRIEGQTIVTNQFPFLPSPSTPPPQPPLNFRYMSRITDPTLFDPSFVEALAWKLAAELCETITASTAKLQTSRQGYKDAISTALRANAMEQPPEPIAASTWLTSRIPG